MTAKIIGLAVLLVIGYLLFRPRHKTDMQMEHGGQGDDAKDVSPHAGHGHNAGRSSKKPRGGGGCCG